jgi:Protein of unknown function (DUF2867)
MKSAFAEIPVPTDAAISSFYRGADFRDSYSAAIGDDQRSALAIYLDVVARTPAWIDAMMATRNRVVSVFGLKNLGTLGNIESGKPIDEYKVGDRIGIFSLHHNSFNEVILGDSDRHLDAKVSVRRTVSDDKTFLQVTTVVHIHNLLGRVYMAVVVPAHRRIVPTMLKRYATRS